MLSPINNQMDDGYLEEITRNEAPERQLLFAVLDRALRDIYELDIDFLTEIQKERLQHSHVVREARAWFRSRSMEPFSFRWLIQELEMDPRPILDIVAKIPERRERCARGGKQAAYIWQLKASSWFQGQRMPLQGQKGRSSGGKAL